MDVIPQAVSAYGKRAGAPGAQAGREDRWRGPLASIGRAGHSAACRSSSAVDCRTMGRAAELPSFATEAPPGAFRTVSAVGPGTPIALRCPARGSHGALRRDRPAIQEAAHL